MFLENWWEVGLTEIKSQLAPGVAAKLREAFEKFVQDPTESLRISVRHRRAQELRSLLFEHDLDLAIFNREVWPIAAPRKPGETASLFESLFTPARLSDVQRSAVKEELENPATVLHGNWHWGSGSAILGPKLTDQERLNAVSEAARILGDSSLPPLKKAQQIDDLPGFGRNAATGLVMIFHPEDFAIYNEQSIAAVQKLGLSAGSMEEFEQSASLIRDVAGASDFIELDWFLYQLKQGNVALADGASTPPVFWWVNQGHNFDEERNGGFIRSPKQDKGGNTPFQYANVSQVKPGDLLFHHTKGIRALSVATSAAMDRKAMGAAWSKDWDGWLVKTKYELLKQPVPLEAVASDVRAAQTSQCPIGSDGRVQSKYLFRLEEPAARAIAQQIDLNSVSPLAAAVLRRLTVGKTAPKTIMNDLNVILYGPPGTGKTYRTVEKAVSICDGQAPANRRELMSRFRAVRLSGGRSALVGVGEVASPVEPYQVIFDYGNGDEWV